MDTPTVPPLGLPLIANFIIITTNHIQTSEESAAPHQLNLTRTHAITLTDRYDIEREREREMTSCAAFA